MMRATRTGRWLLGICAVLGLAAAESSSFEQGKAAFQAGRYSVALPLLQKAVQESGKPDAKLYLAITEAAANDCASALPVLNGMLTDSDPDRSRMAVLAAARCYSSEGDNARASTILS